MRSLRRCSVHLTFDVLFAAAVAALMVFALVLFVVNALA